MTTSIPYSVTWGGGLSSEQDPARHPLTIDLELNEWKVTATRIVSPDHRRHRLSLGKEGEATTWNGTSMPLRSNTVEFEVQPADPDRQASQLASVTGVLDSPGASKEDKKHAARVLRFLGSEASTRELARRYASGQGPFEWDFKFGLYSTPYR
jgi:hypothetical protein